MGLFKYIRIAVAGALLTVFGCSEGETMNRHDGIIEEPFFLEATVHDPSVLKTGETYYVFGSHLASAKTNDLIQWVQVSEGVAAGNPLIPDPYAELAETFEWAETTTLWAADVIQLADGKFYMYYNACRGDSPLSALGVAVSDNVEGPYSNLGILLKSGMTAAEPLPDGGIYDATVHPNVVDPDVFFDKDGQLWMIYGSYSGGIYILKMDPKTGMPEPGQGFGKKLLGGNHARIEGPYMLYHPQTDYYYLFLSYGGLDSYGGYNIRVARSAHPDGPFVDAAGNDMAQAMGAPGTIFDDRSIEPFGTKLMGGFQWTGPDGTGTLGYISPGHNSAYYDEAEDKTYLFFHTRFPSMGETHSIRVHQLFFNADGWPVVAPHRYAGERIGTYGKREIAGDYQLIDHGQDISADPKRSVIVKLGADGRISGEHIGRWKLKDGHAAEIEIDGVSYTGVFVRQRDMAAGHKSMAFTVLSEDGTALWGSMLAESQ